MKVKTLLKGIKELKSWRVWLLEYCKLVKNKTIILYKFRNGLKLFVRSYTADRGIVQEVILHKCYYDLVKQGDTVIDIGAQAGYYSSKAIIDGASRVIAFEPIEDNYKLCEFNIKQNIKPNQRYDLYKKAVVGSNINELKLYKDDDNTGGHSLIDNEGESVTVETMNINDIMDKLLQVDIFKCDCEGGEYDILYNMTDENYDKIEKFVIELHPLYDGRMPFDITNLLEKKGYKIYTKSKSLTDLSIIYAVKNGK